ncbi:putative parathyroid hormone 2 receptor [Trichinella spiralis]|uniref:putative parathyroid hormone 2 receptor n=1 Tax=Trichinella spiralis TaxID=6334 RepID=UPI0001EFCC2D|nr:putative parathyroid hormone 2 receptor [Trichinella spiralis]
MQRNIQEHIAAALGVNVNWPSTYSYGMCVPWNVEFPRILVANVHTPVDVFSLMHYVFTQILRYFHAVLDCASMKADILHFQTCLDQLISLEQVSGTVSQPPPVHSASFPFTLTFSVWLSRYHYCYGVEPLKQKQLCIEITYPQIHTH